MLVKPIKTKLFSEGEDLMSFITSNIKKVKEESIIVITSKIVSLSESRTVAISPKTSVEYQREKIIRSECEYMIKTPYVWLTIKDGTVMASAGVDESNAFGKFILLPKNSFTSATMIRKNLQKHYGVKKLGVLITDSRLLPLRSGVVGVALGYAGFEGIRDYRGTKDIFGRIFKLSRTDVADSLATAAVLVMGEGSEQRPLAVIQEESVKFNDKVYRKELFIDVKEDMYGPLFKKFSKS